MLRSRRLRLSKSKRWKALRAALLEEVNRRCQRCGKYSVLLEVHHKRPVQHGGPYFDRSNLEVLCRNCHCLAHRTDRTRMLAKWIGA